MYDNILSDAIPFLIILAVLSFGSAWILSFGKSARGTRQFRSKQKFPDDAAPYGVRRNLNEKLQPRAPRDSFHNQT